MICSGLHRLIQNLALGSANQRGTRTTDGSKGNALLIDQRGNPQPGRIADRTGPADRIHADKAHGGAKHHPLFLGVQVEGACFDGNRKRGASQLAWGGIYANQLSLLHGFQEKTVFDGER
jgi:hypothetical protein